MFSKRPPWALCFSSTPKEPNPCLSPLRRRLIRQLCGGHQGRPCRSKSNSSPERTRWAGLWSTSAAQTTLGSPAVTYDSSCSVGKESWILSSPLHKGNARPVWNCALCLCVHYTVGETVRTSTKDQWQAPSLPLSWRLAPVTQ